MFKHATFALIATTTLLVGPVLHASPQDSNVVRVGHPIDPMTAGGQDSADGDRERFIRFEFPGGSMREYTTMVKDAMGGVLFGREPINFLIDPGVDPIVLPRIDLVLPEKEFFEIAMKAIIGVAYQVEPDIAGMVTVDFIGGATVRIGAKYWRGSSSIPDNARIRTSTSVAGLQARESWSPNETPSVEITVLPVLNLDVVEAAEAISFALAMTPHAESSQIMAHEPTGTIIFQGVYDAAELAKEVLEAAEAVKAHERAIDAEERELFEAGRAEGLEEATSEAQLDLARIEERYVMEIQRIQDEASELLENYRARIEELEAALEEASSDGE